MIASLEELGEGFGVPPLIVFTLLIVTLISLYAKYTYSSQFQFWSKQGIEGPKPLFYFGNSLDLLFSGPLLDRLARRRAKYGPIYGIYRGSMPQLYVHDPEMIKDILVRDWTSFADRTGGTKSGNPVTDNFLTNLVGNDWKRMRSVMSPTFTSGKMKFMFTAMNDCCHLMTENIRKKITESESNNQKLELNMRHLAGCYSMDVIAKCCFATETNSFDDPNHVFVSYARKVFQIPKTRLLLAFLAPARLRKLLGIAVMDSDSIGFLAHVSRSMLAQRKANGKELNHSDKKSTDYLQLLIDASNEGQSKRSNDTAPDNESHHGYEDKVSDKVIAHELKKPLTVDEIVSNSVLFLAVGYDTTSALITMTSYCLACNQSPQEKLYQELKESFDQNGGIFDYETISGLKYLDAVVSETLRIFPPAPNIERRLIEDYTFKKNGINVPKGGNVVLPIWSIHHDDTLWPEPESFQPERFLPENRSKIIPYSYVPFGGGPRNCIGMRFALLEAKLAIAHLMINFKFTPCSQTDIPLDLSKTLVLLNPKRVFVGVEERKD